MNSLQALAYNRMQQPTADPLDSLPKWLRYLAGAFPSAKVSMATFAVLEDQFSDTDPAVMYQVARKAVRNHLFASFPTVGELRRAVEGLEYETAVTSRPRVNLNQVRHQLFERGYQGDINPLEWVKLYRQFIANKRLNGAQVLLVKFRQFFGEDLIING